MSGLREASKATRRNAILDATAALLRERSFDEVTVEEIASLASVAPATVDNLIVADLADALATPVEDLR